MRLVEFWFALVWPINGPPRVLSRSFDLFLLIYLLFFFFAFFSHGLGLGLAAWSMGALALQEDPPKSFAQDKEGAMRARPLPSSTISVLFRFFPVCSSQNILQRFLWHQSSQHSTTVDVSLALRRCPPDSAFGPPSRPGPTSRLFCVLAFPLFLFPLLSFLFSSFSLPLFCQCRMVHFLSCAYLFQRTS